MARKPLRVTKLTLFDNRWNSDSSVSLEEIKCTLADFSLSFSSSVKHFTKKPGNNRDRTAILFEKVLNRPDLFVRENMKTGIRKRRQSQLLIWLANQVCEQIDTGHKPSCIWIVNISTVEHDGDVNRHGKHKWSNI